MFLASNDDLHLYTEQAVPHSREFNFGAAECLAQYSCRKSEQWYFSRHFQCDKAVLPICFMVNFASIHYRYLALSLPAHAADVFRRAAIRCGMWWCLSVLGMVWWFGISPPCLVDGVLAEVSARRCLYFFPSSLYVWGTHFQSSLARFKQAQQESKSMHHLPLLMLELICDFPRNASFGSLSFSCHG